MNGKKSKLYPHIKPMEVMEYSSALTSGIPVTLKTVDYIDKPILHVSEKASIVETMEVIDLVATLANTVYLFISFGWIRGVTNAIKLLWKLPKAIEGIQKLPQEILDIDEEEKNQLIELVRDRLIFAEDVESVIALVLDLVHKLKILVGLFKR